MKKLYFLAMSIPMVFTATAQQDTITPLNWADVSASDFYTTAFPKKIVKIAHAPADWVFDENTFVLDSVWKYLGKENKCDVSDADKNVVEMYEDGVFSGTWKAWFDDSYLYVGIKWVDPGKLATAAGPPKIDQRDVEIMIQTDAYKRYEPAFQAAKGKTGRNSSYFRCVELGGFKYVTQADALSVVGKDPFSGSQSNSALTGTWSDNPHFVDHPLSVYTIDAKNTLWATIQFDYTTHLAYYDDPLSSTHNDVAFDPAVKDTIAFDIKLQGKDVDGNISEYFWNSNIDNGYCLIYYNGLVTFGLTDTLSFTPGTGIVNKPITIASVYMAGDVLKLKGMNNANLNIYSTIGQLVRSGRQVNQMNLSDLPRGIYLVRVEDLNKTFKIMKR